MIGESRKDDMAAPITPDSYKEMILFLATAGVVVPLFHRLRISPVLGFLGAGALLGPFGLGRLAGEFPVLTWFTIANREEMAHLAEFGVVFLMFMIGIELTWERLRTLRRLVFGFGALQVAGSAAVIAVLTYAIQGRVTASILVGLALALSSTAIVVPLLASQRRLNSATGRTTFSVLLFQDLAVAPILFIIGVLGSGESGNVALSFLLAFGQAALALVVLVGVGRLVLRPLFQLVAATRSPELFMAASFLVVLVTGLIAAMSGLSMSIGAFVAGLLLAETEYRRAIEAMIDPFKGLLLGVFFVSVGAGLDVTRLAANPILILAGTFLLIGMKAAVIAWVAAVFRLPRQVTFKTALLLGPGGEFAFVILGAAMAAGLVPETLGQESLVIATVSMFAIPALAGIGLNLGDRLAQPLPAGSPPEPPPPDETGRVVIAGFGRVGQLVGEMLARHKVPYVAVDTDPGLVASHRKAGKPVYYGDSTSVEFLRACGLDYARALVVTINSPTATESVVGAARQAHPDLTIVARARDDRHAAALYKLGVFDAVPENFEASLQLSEAVLVDIGVPMGLVIASIHERRDEFRNVLKQTGEARAAASVGEFRGRRTAGKRGA
jgi:CPA2 family monovalent cation:H+ antiporter-2